jgi:hypothetical protein
VYCVELIDDTWSKTKIFLQVRDGHAAEGICDQENGRGWRLSFQVCSVSTYGTVYIPFPTYLISHFGPRYIMHPKDKARQRIDFCVR